MNMFESIAGVETFSRADLLCLKALQRRHWMQLLQKTLMSLHIEGQVLISEPLAAKSLKRQGGFDRSRELGGVTEMSAPVSTKKFLPEAFSLTNRQFTEGP